MPCGTPITQEPISGGLDALNHRGTGRPIDFELILNMDGSKEAGYFRGMGWNRYMVDATCAGGYINWDLHDHMWTSQELVDITPPAVPISPLPAATPFHNWVIKVKTNRFALLKGELYIHVTYDSAGVGSGEADYSFTVTQYSEQWMQLLLPGDATKIHVDRLIGVITSVLTESPIEPPAAAPGGELPSEECEPFLPAERQEITLLESVTLSNGTRRLVAATRSTIYVNDDRAGNWKVVADGLGDTCGGEVQDASVSFKMVMMGDIAVFTNDFDFVLAYKFVDMPAGPYFWLGDFVLELQALRISTAAVISKYGGFVLIGDLTADGARQTSLLHWSDYNDPLSWVPGGNSAAGFHDFGHGERILRIEPIGGYIRVYTDQAIYDGRNTLDDEIFHFDEIYRNEDKASLPIYKNAFIVTDDRHYWLGADSIYSAGISDREPQRIEWIHVASGIIFSGIKPVVVEGIPDMASYPAISRRRSRLPVGFYDNVAKALYFSWPTTSDGPNDLSLVLWLKYGKATVVNWGFTAGVNHAPDQTITVRDFMDSRGICASDDLRYPKEGTPCDQGIPLVEFPYLYNATERTDQPMDPQSLIASLCDVCLEDLCGNDSTDIRFLVATTGDDISIKQMGECRWRENLTGRIFHEFPDSSEGCYVQDGFTSLLGGRLNRYGSTKEKETQGLSFNISTPDGDAELNAQIGVSDCADTTYWSLVSIRNACESSYYEVDEDKAVRYKARPRRALFFPIEKMGKFLTFRIYVSGTDNCFEVSSTHIWLKEGC